MGNVDFPGWFAAGCYGGLGCCLAAASAIAIYALRAHKGTPRQVAVCSLACLLAGLLMLAPAWWLQQRFDLADPADLVGEAIFWLIWIGLFGWVAPLCAVAAYILLATPERSLGYVLPHSRVVAPQATPLHDPVRLIEPRGAGVAWGRLTPLDGPASGRAIPLQRQITLLGRDASNDIIVDDERASRFHAEIRWSDESAYLLDRASLNGTLHNAQRVAGIVPLGDGDVLELGTRRYRYELGSPSLTLPSAETRKVSSVATQRRTLPLAAELELVAEQGALAGSRWKIRGALLTIGRDESNIVCLPDTSVSRQHAQIVRQAAGYFLSDLNSSNGTTVNGAALIAPALLRIGDVLRFGEIGLRCVSGVSLGYAPPTVADTESETTSVDVHSSVKQSASPD